MGAKGSNLNDKKPAVQKSSEVEHEKKEEGEEKVQDKKSHTSKEKDPKSIQNSAVKSPGGNKKPI